METYSRSESVKPVPQNRHFQNGNAGNHLDLTSKRGVGDVAGFQRRLLSHPHSPQVEEVAFPPVSLLNQVISKVVDQGCLRMILIAPGWPNMPWFWDLVNLSVQIPLSLPPQKDLVTQPFNRLPHRDLSSLNLHAWLLEPPSFRDKGSLVRWQHELRLLRDSQPDQFTSQSGPFLSSGVSQTRWTSGRPL